MSDAATLRQPGKRACTTTVLLGPAEAVWSRLSIAATLLREQRLCASIEAPGAVFKVRRGSGVALAGGGGRIFAVQTANEGGKPWRRRKWTAGGHVTSR